MPRLKNLIQGKYRLRNVPLRCSFALTSFVRTASVDHNIFKHLNLNKSSALDEVERNPLTYPEEVKGKMLMVVDQNSYIERNKKFTELDQIPVPSFDEKKQLREDMFFFLEDSTIEETRIEIEIDQAREKGDLKLVEELTDALYVLQRINSEKLMNLITEYQPQTGTKSWGSDPDYTKLSRQLVALAESYAIHEESSQKKKF
jgi:hypothetical protein